MYERQRTKFYTMYTKGCMTIFDKIGVNLEGKHVIVIGRSNIVGIPGGVGPLTVISLLSNTYALNHV